MLIFDTMEQLVEYLAIRYPKSKGKEIASWHVSDLLMLVGVYEGSDLINGFFIFKDPTRDYRWVLVDNFHADLATRYYIEYIQELQEAIALFEIDNLFAEGIYDEVIEENEVDFFEDLD